MHQSKRLPRWMAAAVLTCLIGACSTQTDSPALPGSGSSTLFEGARLIAGDGTAPVENSAFLVQENVFVSVGRMGDIDVPDDALVSI